MFKRYTIYTNSDQLVSTFKVNLNELDTLTPNYNAGPGGMMPILVSGLNRERVLVSASWNTEVFNLAKTQSSLLSAQIQKSPELTKVFQRKRCLILMNGYYDWKKITESLQVPFYFRILSQDVFAVAGIYENDASGSYSFIPIETRANEIVEPLSETMPAIISGDMFDKWLDPLFPTPEKLHDLLVPHKTIEMSSYRVNLKLTDVESNSKDLIQPVV